MIAKKFAITVTAAVPLTIFITSATFLFLFIAAAGFTIVLTITLFIFGSHFRATLAAIANTGCIGYCYDQYK
jgi:hypothetical protein